MESWYRYRGKMKIHLAIGIVCGFLFYAMCSEA